MNHYCGDNHTLLKCNREKGSMKISGTEAKMEVMETMSIV